MTSRQRSGFLFLVGIIIVAELIIQFYPFSNAAEKQAFTPEELAFIAQDASKLQTSTQEDNTKVVLFPFNPNALDKLGYMRLGFSEKQAGSIIKYRYIKGGNFATIEEFGASYVISHEKLEELRPYIQLKPVQQPEKDHAYISKNIHTKRLKPFRLNQKNAKDFMALGFSDKQAQTIINFRNSLPDKRFISKEQFAACYAVNDYMFKKLKPYIIIDQPIKTNEAQVATLNYKINSINAQQFVNLGFSKLEASNIIKYRDFIGGFKDLESFKACPYVRADLYEALSPYIIIE